MRLKAVACMGMADRNTPESKTTRPSNGILSESMRTQPLTSGVTGCPMKLLAVSDCSPSGGIVTFTDEGPGFEGLTDPPDCVNRVTVTVAGKLFGFIRTI